MRDTKLILTIIVAIVLFIGGLILFLSKNSIWSLFLGIPAIQIGIVFLIFAFDKLSTDDVDEDSQSPKK